MEVGTLGVGNVPDLPWRVEVLDHGYVELVDVMPRGGDLIAALARSARVSYTQPTLDDADPEASASRSDKGLAAYLMSHGHVSPLDQIKLQFIVQCPRFVRDQWYRHWSWDYNEVSARYMEMPELYYVPPASQVRAQSTSNKQGRGDLLGETTIGWFISKVTDRCSQLFKEYRYAVGERGMAKELARVMLPHGTYTRFQATVSLRDLAFFLRQRTDPHAQWEIRQYAEAIGGMLRELDPEAYKLLDNYLIRSVNLPANAAEVLAAFLSRVDLEALPVYMDLPKRDRQLVDTWLGTSK